MPIWIQENNSPREIGKLWVQESTGPAQISKIWVQESDEPKLIYNAQQTYGNVTVASNYAYGGQGNWSGWRTQISSVNYNMSEYATLNFSYSCPITHTWANGNGDQYEANIYVNFNGTDYNVASKSGTMYWAGDVQTWTGTATVTLSNYSTTQLSKINFKSTIRCKKPSDETGDKRIGADLSITNIVAE